MGNPALNGKPLKMRHLPHYTQVSLQLGGDGFTLPKGKAAVIGCHAWLLLPEPTPSRMNESTVCVKYQIKATCGIHLFVTVDFADRSAYAAGAQAWYALASPSVAGRCFSDAKRCCVVRKYQSKN